MYSHFKTITWINTLWEVKDDQVRETPFTNILSFITLNFVIYLFIYATRRMTQLLADRKAWLWGTSFPNSGPISVMLLMPLRSKPSPVMGRTTTFPCEDLCIPRCLETKATVPALHYQEHLRHILNHTLEEEQLFSHVTAQAWVLWEDQFP